MKTVIRLIACICLSWALHSPALVLVGDGDSHTNAPAIDGGCGRNTQVLIIENLGTRLDAQWLLVASHLSNYVGQAFSHGGSNYTITVVSNSPAKGGLDADILRCIKVSPPLPSISNSFAKPSTQSACGLQFTMFGAGRFKGEIVTTTLSSSLTIAHLAVSDTNSILTITGQCWTGAKVWIQTSTNLTDWVTSSNCYTMTTTNPSMSVSMAACEGQAVFYRLMTSVTNITNGWKVVLPDGNVRWGKNQFGASLENGLLTSTFDLTGPQSCGDDEATVWSGDSSGGCFAKIGGSWKLVGVIQSTPAGSSWYKQAIGDPFRGAMCDQSGLDFGDYNQSQNIWTYFVTFPIDGTPKPVSAQYIPVAPFVSWLEKVVGHSLQ